MGGVSQRIKAGENIQRDIGITVPDIGHRNAQIFGISAGSVHTDSAGAHAQVAPAGQTVATTAANHMPLTGDQVAGLKIMDIAADLGHPADKLMADMHGHGYGFPGPIIPIVNMDIGAADCGFMDLYQHIVDTNLRNGHFFQPQSRFRSGLDQGVHFTLHAYLQTFLSARLLPSKRIFNLFIALQPFTEKLLSGLISRLRE